MGKKSRAKAPSAPQKNKKEEKEELPQWHDALPKATVENVLELEQVDHGWICTILRTEAINKKHHHGILAIMDITNRVRGEGMDARYMNVGPCPNPRTEGGDIAKALFATMMQPHPGPKDDAPEYFAPRRPAWVLLEKDLANCLDLVQETLASVNVAVKLNTPEALAEGQDEAEDNNGRTATWDAGLAIGATADNVSKLPEKENEIWKCSMTMLEDESTSAKECFMAVEDITDGTDEDKSYPLGVGPCAAPTLNPDGMVKALFATMLSPRAKEGGYGTGRRPGRVILDKALEPWMEHLQQKVGAVEVAVELE